MNIQIVLDNVYAASAKKIKILH